MACIHNNFDSLCSLFDDNIDNSGYSEDGYCICDPNPSDTCGNYESDDVCPECG